MAYFADPAQIKIINFIPVQTLGSPRTSPALLGSYTSLGNTGAGAVPAVTVPKIDVQRALIGAGRLAPTMPSGRSSADGDWGDRSRTAMRAFADSLPEPARLSSVAWGSASYRSLNTQNVSIPSVWASALKLGGPAAASGGGATTDGATTGGAATGGKVQSQGDGTTGGAWTNKPEFMPSADELAELGTGRGLPPQPDVAPGGSGPARVEEKKFPWMWVGLGAAGLVAVGAVVLLSRRS